MSNQMHLVTFFVTVGYVTACCTVCHLFHSVYPCQVYLAMQQSSNLPTCRAYMFAYIASLQPFIWFHLLIVLIHKCSVVLSNNFLMFWVIKVQNFSAPLKKKTGRETVCPCLLLKLIVGRALFHFLSFIQSFTFSTFSTTKKFVDFLVVE